MIVINGNDEGVVVEEGDEKRAMDMEILCVQMERQGQGISNENLRRRRFQDIICG